VAGGGGAGRQRRRAGNRRAETRAERECREVAEKPHSVPDPSRPSPKDDHATAPGESGAADPSLMSSRKMPFLGRAEHGAWHVVDGWYQGFRASRRFCCTAEIGSVFAPAHSNVKNRRTRA